MLWLVSAAWAHRPGLSYAAFADGELTLTFAAPELSARVPLGPELEASRIVLRELTLDAATLEADGARCTFGEARVERAAALGAEGGDDDGVTLVTPYTCPPGTLRYEAGFLSQLDPGHRQVVTVDGAAVGVLDAKTPAVAFTGASEPVEVARRFFGLGLEHIWTGYDHLLFLFGLLLVAPSLRAMLLVVTGFTVAHSLTLSAAALGLVTLPASLVEPAIAGSIAWVGVENLWRPSPRRRAVATFLLGLVHGFGFAGMLAALGLPQDALAVALLAFNGGVEVGQAALVAVVLPILLRLRRHPAWEGRVVPFASILVALAGFYWLVERVAAG